MQIQESKFIKNSNSSSSFQKSCPNLNSVTADRNKAQNGAQELFWNFGCFGCWFNLIGAYSYLGKWLKESVGKKGFLWF